MTTSAGSTHTNFVGHQEGEAIWFNGGLVNVKVPGDWSDGALSLCEVEMERGRATGLHTDSSDETFYVLDGELLFHVDGEERRVRAGETIGVKRGVAHAFITVSDSARFLVLNSPGTHDAFFRDGGYPARDRDFANAPAPDLERTRAAAEQHGVALLGPAPFSDVRLQSG